MEFLDETYFTEDQKWLIHLRLNEKMSYRQIQAAWAAAHVDDDDAFLSAAAIKTSFKRSALAFSWKKGKLYGKEMFLSKPDIENLSDYISQRCQNGDPSDAADVLSEAVLIRKKRQVNAISFLRAINCNNIAEELENTEIDTPVRSWINCNLEELCCKIRSAQVVDYDRYFACSSSIITSFFNISSECLSNVPPALIFGADELGLDPTIKKKYIILKDVHDFLARNAPIEMPHFSVMFSHNAIGASPPPYLIIPNLKKCPSEVTKYISNSQIWCCSTESGWENRDSFLLWTVNFINWLSNYRLNLDPEIRNERAVLILDGHCSRENPIAIYILKINNVDVLVLPAHTTHLLQMFDVVLAKPFKKLFSRKFNEYFSQKCLLNLPLAAIIRDCAVKSLIESWDEVCTIDNCSTAAKDTGTYPQDLDIILANAYVHDLTEEEQLLMRKKRKNNRLNINGKVITQLDNLKEINEAIHQKDAFRHLCVTGPVDYIPFCIEKSQYKFDDVILFSKFHRYSCQNEAPVFF